MTDSRILPLACGLLLAANFLRSQEATKPLEDNSFLLEEAFNQEARVVQHIFTFTYFRQPGDELAFSFTQEWPVGSQAHQLSFSLPAMFMNDGGTTGLGDVLINYRYQLTGGEGVASVAPRFSVMIPTGVDRMSGDRGVGFQLAVPYSKYLSEELIVHANVGVNFTPKHNATALMGPKLVSTLAGCSAIWLATPRLNFMCELVLTTEEEEDPKGAVLNSQHRIVSPGIRYGIDVGSLQIVPGLAFPLEFEDGYSRHGVLFYLSFEHPF